MVYVWDAVANFFSIALPNATIEVNDLDVELTRELVHDHTPEEIRIAARVLAVLIRTAVRGRR